MGIAAGRLSRRITIERATTAKNDLNEDVATWSTLTTVWAEATPLSDGERIRAQEVAAQISMRFVIRWSPIVAGIDPRDRIVYAGRLYDVWGVKELGLREGLEISANARSDLIS